MQKSKSNRPRDRLSELPDSLIFQIFWFMPMTGVVRTTLLSKRWKNLWTINPCLNFDCSELDEDEVRVRNFVNRVLLSWRGIKILKFRCYPRESLFSDFNLWVCFAVDKNVEELYVHGNEIECTLYLVPQCLYSCSSLKVLLLEDCELKIHGNVQWNHLKSLTIDGRSGCHCAHVFNQILLGSPQLEVLILGLEDTSENLNIRSSSLKRLSFANYLCYHDPADIELRICTPNLETLEISGVPYGKCMLMNVSSLTDATLWFYGENRRDYFLPKDIDLWDTLRPILPTIQHVEKVRLSDWCIKVIGDAKRKHLLSPFPNVKFLTLYAICVEYGQIFGLLEIFPKLKMLVLQDESKARPYTYPKSLKFDAKSSLKFEANLPKSFLQQLRAVEITLAESDNSIFPFIEILLKHASNLEKMVICVIRVDRMMPSSDSLILASHKLLGIQRSSPNCRISLL
ncbi:hypothetical protein C2S52_014540 [Perilla frutescens var. hirtella]|nr:hypothetical protein C2S52_014540 [Perilla frutescens var. hirtella]